MKTALCMLLLLASANAFTNPLMATRAISSKKTGTKVVAKKTATKTKAVAAKPKAKVAIPKFTLSLPTAAPKKAAPKKAAPKKAAPKKAAPKKKAVVARKAAPKKATPKPRPAMKRTSRAPPPSSKSYPSFADKASAVSFKGISGSGLFPSPTGGIAQPNFADPKLQIKRDPAFYAAAAAERAAKLGSRSDFVIEDGLTDLERKQRSGSQSTFLTGSAKSQKDSSSVIGEIDAPAFGGLSADRFQLLFISIFGLFTLVGSLANAKPYV